MFDRLRIVRVAGLATLPNMVNTKFTTMDIGVMRPATKLFFFFFLLLPFHFDMQ